MKNNMRPVILAIILMGTAACSQKLAFQGSDTSTPASVKVPVDPLTGVNCQAGTQLVSQPTKFILVVDQSGSNFDGPYEHPGDATDKDKSRRGGAITDFLALYGGQSNIAWSFITFNGTSAHALISTNGSDQSPAFGSSSAMSAALATFMATTDQGNTPYLAATTMVQSLIQADLSSAAASTQYRVVFLTDGYPTDLAAGPALETAVDNGVMGVVNLKSANIQFSTVYYGLPDATASARLQRMATEGGGAFLDASQSTSLHLNNVVQVPTTICQ